MRNSKIVVKANEGRTKKARRNVFFGILNKILTIILEFISRYFFIKYLGAEFLGLNDVFTNVIQCLSLAELGMNNVVMFSYYEPLAKNDKRKISALNCYYRKIYNIIAFSVLLIGIGILPFLNSIINSPEKIEHIHFIFLIYLIDTFVSYLCVYKTIIYTADQNAYIEFSYNMAINLIRTLIQIVLLIIFRSYVLYLSIKIIFSILGNLIKAESANRAYSYLKSKESLSSEDKKIIVKTIKSGFVYKLSSVLLNSTDNILISILVGTVWVGYISNYVTIYTAVASFVSIIFSSLIASIGNLATSESKEKRLQIFNVMELISNWIAIVCFICTFLLCDDFITLWLGKEYVLDTLTVLTKVMMIYVSCVMQPIFSYREALGLFTKTKNVMLLAALINIGLSIIWGTRWGIAGILAASLVSVFITYFWYEPAILYKDNFEISPYSYYKRIFINILLCVILTLIQYFTFKNFRVITWWAWFIKAILIFLLTNITCFLKYKYFDTDEFNYALAQLSKVIRRNEYSS